MLQAVNSLWLDVSKQLGRPGAYDCLDLHCLSFSAYMGSPVPTFSIPATLVSLFLHHIHSVAVHTTHSDPASQPICEILRTIVLSHTPIASEPQSIMCTKLLQSCLTFCHPMDCSPPGSSVCGIFDKDTGMGCLFLLQGVFPMQISNWCLLHWQVDSLPLSHLGSPVHRWYLTIWPHGQGFRRNYPRGKVKRMYKMELSECTESMNIFLFHGMLIKSYSLCTFRIDKQQGPKV